MASREMNGTNSNSISTHHDHPTTSSRPPHHHHQQQQQQQHQQQQHQQQQQQRHHHHHHQSSSSSSSAASFKGCCCCLFLLLTFLGLLVLAVILVIVLAVKPKKPQFELQQVAVQYVGISSTNTITNANTAASASLSLSIKMLFTAVNPNKVGIKYSPTQFYVMYRGVPLGLASVPGFFQPAHSLRQLQTTVSVDRVNLLQADATDLLKDATLNDRVELRITGDVGAKIRILDLTSPRVKVSVDCVIVISPRRQTLTYKQCGVDGLSV